jgi:hypothetical protein
MAEEKDRVYYNDEWMASGWPEQIQAAQREPTYVIRGVAYARIPYGSEVDDWGAERRSCHDCGVRKGQLHVPGCDVEQCPRCSGQSLSCDCQDEPPE